MWISAPANARCGAARLKLRGRRALQWPRRRRGPRCAARTTSPRRMPMRRTRARVAAACLAVALATGAEAAVSTLTDCLEGSDFVANAARSRDNGMTPRVVPGPPRRGPRGDPRVPVRVALVRPQPRRRAFPGHRGRAGLRPSAGAGAPSGGVPRRLPRPRARGLVHFSSSSVLLPSFFFLPCFLSPFASASIVPRHFFAPQRQAR